MTSVVGPEENEEKLYIAYCVLEGLYIDYGVLKELYIAYSMLEELYIDYSMLATFPFHEMDTCFAKNVYIHVCA